MNYEWDEKKREASIAKHGVDFLLVEEFDWDTAFETIDDRKDYGEERWVALGCIKKRLHVLVYTLRTDCIRVISLRKANKQERAFYESKA